MNNIFKFSLTLFLAFFVTSSTQAMQIPVGGHQIVINVQGNAPQIAIESKIKTFFKKHWVKIAIATGVTVATGIAFYYFYGKTHAPMPPLAPGINSPQITKQQPMTPNPNEHINRLNQLFTQPLEGKIHPSCTRINPNDIRIVSITTNGRESFASIAEKSQKAYANAHGYSYALYKDSPTYSVKTDLANKVPTDWNCRDQAHKLPEEWLKISAVNQQLQDPSTKWTLWMDDDMYITNPKKKLESFIEQYGKNNNLIIAKDPYYGLKQTSPRGKEITISFNNGIFLLKNNEAAKDFLKKVWERGVCNNRYTQRGTSLLEQQAMTDIYLKNSTIQKNTKLLETRNMNSIIRFDSYGDRPAVKWQHGDFIAHVTGVCNKFREKVFDCLDRIFSHKKAISQQKTNKIIDWFRRNGRTLYCPDNK